MWLHQLHQVLLLQALVPAVHAAPVVQHTRAQDHGLAAAEPPCLPICEDHACDVALCAWTQFTGRIPTIYSMNGNAPCQLNLVNPPVRESTKAKGP